MDKPHFDHYSQSAPEYTEQILWHRLVVTIVVAILIVAGSAWVAYKFLKKPEAETPIAPGFSDVGESNTPEDDSRMAAGMAAADNSSTLHVSTHTELSENAATAESASTESNDEVSTSVPLTEAAKPESSDVANAPTVAVATTTPTPQSQTQSETETQAESAPKPSSPGAYRVSTRIQSNDITRAELADEMVDLEPKAALENTANLTAPFMKLYFYTDLNDRAGDRLTYTWSRNGEVAARVRIGVGSDRWRSHSSKNINEKMRGDWEVVVTDKQGQTLASSRFVIPEADTTHP